MKTCEQIEELVSVYVDGEATDDETTEVFFHLGTCMKCRTFFTQVLQLQSFLKEQKDPIPDVHIQASVLEPSRLQAQAPPRTSETPSPSVSFAEKFSIWKRNFVVPFPIAAAVAALMLLCGGLLIVEEAHGPKVVKKTQTEFVYVLTIPAMDIVASPLPPQKTN